MKQQGSFIVIEGTDGSGKGTQARLLIDKLKQLKIPSEIIDFPRYEENEYGKLVGRYLKGEFGGLEDINPFLASLAYAGDRMLAGPEIKLWLEDRKLVITNRYVMSNKAYMAARIKKAKRKEFLNWLDNLEYKVNKIPREDLVIFLYLPSEIGQKNVDLKAKRSYLGNKKRDIMESNTAYLKEVEKMYLEFAIENKNWVLINCLAHSKMRSREDIHEEILKILKNKKILL